MSSPKSCLRCNERPANADSDSGLCLVCLASETPRSASTSPPSSDPPPLLVPGSATDTASFRHQPKPADETEAFRAGAPELEPPTRVPKSDTEPTGRAKRPDVPTGYELLQSLGGGGMGDVYLARDVLANRLVAMKFLKAANSTAAHDRFVLELQALAKIDHPHIVRVIHHDFYRAQPFFTMEYVKGGTLADRVKEIGPLDPTEAARLMVQVAHAMTAAHAQGIIHRDLKPSNILVAEDGTPKVSDFGLAKHLDDADGMTSTNGALGTPAFMPPEQLSRRYGAIGDPADVYGLGATLYYLLTGRGPFQGEKDQILIQLPRTEPERVRAIRPEVPLGLEAIVHKCLEKRTADRYQTTAALAADLEKFLAGDAHAIEATELTPVRRARRWVSRNRVALAVAVAAVVVGAVLVWVGARRTDPVIAKQKRLEAINKKVLAGEFVTLVPDKIPARGEPDWFEWRMGPTVFGESPVKDGACSFHSVGRGMLQLFDPPSDRYRLTLQLQHVGANLSETPRTEPLIGLFLGHTEFPREGSTPNHGFLALEFCDFDRELAAGRPAIPEMAHLSWIHLVQPPKGLPARQRVGFATEVFSAKGDFPGAWWSITADVSPEALRVYTARGDEQPKLLANLSRESIRKHLEGYKKFLVPKMQELAPGRVDFGPLPDDWNPRGGAGIWCVDSRVAFKNVVVSPLP